MLSVSRVGDSISGMTTSTHHFHYENGAPIYDTDGVTVIGYEQVKVYDPAVPITGTIANGSSNVFVNGVAVAFVRSATNESDSYDTGTGVVSGGSQTVFVNGKGIARNGDTVTPHNGNASIISGSDNVVAG